MLVDWSSSDLTVVLLLLLVALFAANMAIAGWKKNRRGPKDPK